VRDADPSPPSSAVVKKVELYLYSSNGPYGLYRASVPVHSVEQKSIGLKFSKSRTASHVTYRCHHNLSRFSFPIFAHSWRFSVSIHQKGALFFTWASTDFSRRLFFHGICYRCKRTPLPPPKMLLMEPSSTFVLGEGGSSVYLCARGLT